MENDKYERIVSHLERELELNGLEDPDEMPRNTVTHQGFWDQQNPVTFVLFLIVQKTDMLESSRV